MPKISPHLWFDKEAREASEFYASIFKDSKVKNTTTLHNTPSGSVDLVTVELSGQEFRAISAGPLFKFNPSVSFLVACKSKDEVDALWKRLSERGTVRMELGAYPFSERYGWTEDRYGLSWQVMFAGEREIKQRITPTLMFVGDVCGKAEEAIHFYASLFRRSKVGDILREKEGIVKHAAFTLEGQDFAAMDSAREHKFAFNEAISFMVHCDTQEEIDHYWGKLSAVPGAEQCGWLKDKYGLSWQIIPNRLGELLGDKDPERAGRAMQAMLGMRKIDVAGLEKAAAGR